MEDSAIVDLYWQRSDRAIAETDRKYGRYCHAIAYNICANREDAEECVNDTWFRAWNLMPEERPPFLSAFLGRITRNLAIDLFKTKNRKKRGGGGQVTLALDELRDCVPADLDLERRVELRELERAVGTFTSRLTETEKKIFVSRYWYLTPVAEIAERLGYSQSKTKSILFRLRGRLRTYLQEEGLW